MFNVASNDAQWNKEWCHCCFHQCLYLCMMTAPEQPDGNMGDGWWDCTDEYEYLLGPSVDSLINWKGKENTNKLNLLDTIIMLSSGLISWTTWLCSIMMKNKREHFSTFKASWKLFLLRNGWWFLFCIHLAESNRFFCNAIILFGYLHIAEYLYSDWFQMLLTIIWFCGSCFSFQVYKFCFFLMNDGWFRK